MAKDVKRLRFSNMDLKLVVSGDSNDKDDDDDGGGSGGGGDDEVDVTAMWQ